MVNSLLRMGRTVKRGVTPKRYWQLLLEAGAFSIGPFVVSARREYVRVYHMRTRDICYCSLEASFNEMRRLCRERGYTLGFLLTRYSPKSFQSFTGSGDQGCIEKQTRTNRSKFSGQGALKTFGSVKDAPQDVDAVPGKEIPGHPSGTRRNRRPSLEIND